MAGDTPIAPVIEAGTDTGQPPVDSGNDVAVVPDTDPTFGGGVLVANPKLIFDSMYMNHMLGQLCDGTVLIAGRFDAVATGQDMGLIKLDPTGVAVPSFGTSGIASLPLAANQIPIGAAQDPKSGKVVVIGRTQVGGELVGARFNP
ncbi:MAG TPA: hypothetical protein VF316_11310 [Polyangiaceae bacterium]